MQASLVTILHYFSFDCLRHSLLQPFSLLFTLLFAALRLLTLLRCLPLMAPCRPLEIAEQHFFIISDAIYVYICRSAFHIFLRFDAA